MKPTPATPDEINHTQLRREKLHLREGVWTMLGPGEMTAATEARVAFDSTFAPDGRPWPACWGPEHWIGLPAAQRWAILATARRWDAGAYPVAAAPFRGRHKPLLVFCPDCREKVRIRPDDWFSGQRTHLPGTCGNGHRSPHDRGNTTAPISARAVAAALGIIAASTTVRLVGPPPPTMGRHKARLRCLIHGEEHEALLSNVLLALRRSSCSSGLACCGAHRQPPGNGKAREMAKMAVAAHGPEGLRAAGRLGGLITGPITGPRNGCPIDRPQDVLRGLYHASEGRPTWVYLWATPVPGVRVFGLTNSEDARPNHGAWYQGEEPLAKVRCRRRSDAVLVEAHFKHPDWQVPTPPELQGQVGATELTDATPAVWLERAQELVAQVEELGHQAFAAEYLPWL